MPATFPDCYLYLYHHSVTNTTDESDVNHHEAYSQ